MQFQFHVFQNRTYSDYICSYYILQNYISFLVFYEWVVSCSVAYFQSFMNVPAKVLRVSTKKNILHHNVYRFLINKKRLVESVFYLETMKNNSNFAKYNLHILWIVYVHQKNWKRLNMESCHIVNFLVNMEI